MPTQKSFKVLYLVAFILLSAAPASFAAPASEDRTILTVGSASFSEPEVIRLIMGGSGGNEMMAALMLAQSPLADRRQIVDQIAQAVLFSQGARGAGLDQKPDTAFQIKWQTVQILVQAYFDQVSAGWDFSSAAAEKYFNANRSEFVQKEAVKAAHILTETEQDALMAALEAMGGDFSAAALKYSLDPNTAQNGGDLGWVEKGRMAGPVEEAIMKGTPGQITGPVKSEFGWHIIKIGERRAEKQLTMAEAGETVLQDMQNHYIEQELEKLREKYPVTINDEVLKTLGGIPAPEPAQ